MPGKKLTHTLSDDELLDSLDTENDSALVEDTVILSGDVQNFISAFKLERGKNEVDKSTVYCLYRAWSKSPIDRALFARQCNKHFHTSHSKAWKLNFTTAELSLTGTIVVPKKKISAHKRISVRNHFQAYLNHYGFKPEGRWTHISVLYWLYTKWLWIEKRKTQKGIGTFQKVGEAILGSRLTAKGAYLNINENIVKHLPKGFEDDIEKLSRNQKKYRRWLESTKQKQKRSEVSSRSNKESEE